MTPEPRPIPLLAMHDIVKEFPGVRALDRVDLRVSSGQVHCLLGQNGAGKSTLIKVLSGLYRPDSGWIEWMGRRQTQTGTLGAARVGIGTIYQELDLVDGLTVAENIFLGHELSVGGFSRRRATASRCGEILHRLGHPEIHPHESVGTLSTAQKQIVSVARALSQDIKLIVMDEPSAILDPEEVDVLFRLVGDLKREGVAVIYISHRLAEIQRIGDRITVLKDGRTVATDLAVSDTPTAELTRLMTGRSIEYTFPPRPGVPERAPVVLEVDDLSLEGEFAPVDLTVRGGEIVGVAGLVGAGRSELIETVYGARHASTGRVRVGGRRLPRGSVSAAVRAGVGLCPEERKAQGLLLQEPVYRNVSIASLRRFASAGFVRRREELAESTRQLAAVQLAASHVRRQVRDLSGGNQQKAVLARWLLRGCRVLLLDEPTRGVDVGARSEIYQLIRGLADSGVAVVVTSSEIEEVLGLADHVLVMADGQVVHRAPATELTEQDVLDLVMSGEAA